MPNKRRATSCSGKAGMQPNESAQQHLTFKEKPKAVQKTDSSKLKSRATKKQKEKILVKTIPERPKKLKKTKMTFVPELENVLNVKKVIFESGTSFEEQSRSSKPILSKILALKDQEETASHFHINVSSEKTSILTPKKFQKCAFWEQMQDNNKELCAPINNFYRPGTTYSDVLFNSGPSCSVNIKSMNSEPVLNSEIYPSTHQTISPLKPLSVIGRKGPIFVKGTKFSTSVHINIRGSQDVPKLHTQVQGVSSNLIIKPYTSTLQVVEKPLRNVLNQQKCEIIKSDESLNLTINTFPAAPHKYSNISGESSDFQKKENVLVAKIDKANVTKNKNDPTKQTPMLVNVEEISNKIDNNINASSVCKYLVSAKTKSTNPVTNLGSTLSDIRHSIEKQMETSTCYICYQMSYLSYNIDLIKYKTQNPLETTFKLDLPPWNLTSPDEGPEIFPRYTKQFNDEKYLIAEDIANLGFKLSRGN